MARLDPLIKVRKHAVEEKQRALAELYRQLESFKNQKDQLLLDLAREQALVDADITNLDARAWFGTYAAGVQRKIEQIEAACKKMETRITVATDDIRTAFSEMKKVEITDRERKKREKKALDDKTAQELDAIGIEAYQRQQQDPTGEG